MSEVPLQLGQGPGVSALRGRLWAGSRASGCLGFRARGLRARGVRARGFRARVSGLGVSGFQD